MELTRDHSWMELTRDHSWMELTRPDRAVGSER